MKNDFLPRVQETDGSYFESFTALSWRQENRRLAALRLAEGRAERPPPAAQELGLPSVSAQLSQKEHEHLYTEVTNNINRPYVSVFISTMVNRGAEFIFKIVTFRYTCELNRKYQQIGHKFLRVWHIHGVFIGLIQP